MQPPPPGSPPQWGPRPEDPWEHSPPPGYGGQPGFGSPQQWTGYGPPVPAPNPQQTLGWVSFAVIGVLGLLGAVLTLTLWINLNSAVNRATDVCNRFGGEYANLCRHQIHTMVPGVPPAMVACLFLIIAACLAATAGAVLLFLRKSIGQFLVLGGGVVMLMVSIGLEARFGTTGRVTYDLIAGLVIAVAGGLMLIPAFRVLLGLPSSLTAERGAFPGAGPWPSAPPQPPRFGQGGPPSQW